MKQPKWVKKLSFGLFSNTATDLAKQEVDRVNDEVERLEKMAIQHEALAKVYRDGVARIRSGMPIQGATPIRRREKAA